jgi:hypothetical protein
VVLVALGAVWLSVRGQHPYKGPTATGLLVMYGVLFQSRCHRERVRRTTRGVAERRRGVLRRAPRIQRRPSLAAASVTLDALDPFDPRARAVADRRDAVRATHGRRALLHAPTGDDRADTRQPDHSSTQARGRRLPQHREDRQRPRVANLGRTDKPGARGTRRLLATGASPTGHTRSGRSRVSPWPLSPRRSPAAAPAWT